MPETGTVEEKSEEGFEVFKISAADPVRLQTEPTSLGAETDTVEEKSEEGFEVFKISV